MKFIKSILNFLKVSKKDSEIPPWIKSTKEGKFYCDETDSRYNKFMRDQVNYYTQWTLVKGKMIFKNDKGLNKPNIKDYYNL